MLCLHIESLYFLKYQEQSEYFTLSWLAIVLNKHKLELMFKRMRNMQNLSNFALTSLLIVMSRTDGQNGLKTRFKNYQKTLEKLFKIIKRKEEKAEIT